MVQFTAADRRVRFLLTMPARNERRFTHSSRGARTAAVARKEWEQACRQKWRALALVIKAKLEAVSAGIVTFEEEFFAQIVLPDGSTVYDRAREGVSDRLRHGRDAAAPAAAGRVAMNRPARFTVLDLVRATKVA